MLERWWTVVIVGFGWLSPIGCIGPWPSLLHFFYFQVGLWSIFVVGERTCAGGQKLNQILIYFCILIFFPYFLLYGGATLEVSNSQCTFYLVILGVLHYLA